MTRLIKIYTKEFKQEAVNLALKSTSIINTANECTLHTWINTLKKTEKFASVEQLAVKMPHSLQKIGACIKNWP